MQRHEASSHRFITSRVCALGTLALLAVPAAAQDTTVLLRAGDPLPGGALRFVNGSSVASDGSWASIVRADGPSTASDDYVIRNGAPLFREGDPLPPTAGLAGASWGGFLTLEQSAADETWIVALLGGVPPGIGGKALTRNERIVLRTGDPVVDPRLPAGSYWFDFRVVRRSRAHVLVVAGYIEGPGVYTTAHARVTVDGAGNLVSTELLHIEGDSVPAYTQPLSFLGVGAHEVATNPRGDVLTYAFASGGASTTGVLLNGVGVVLENTPSPVPGRNWSTVAGPEIDLADDGSWIVRARLDGVSDRDILVRNGDVFRRQGQTVAAMGGATLQDFGLSCAPFVGNDGSVLWFGDFTGTTTSDEALFVDDTVLLREGVTMVGGGLVTRVRDQSESYDFAPNGAFVVAEVELETGGAAQESLLLVRLRPGNNECVPATNSTGGTAEIALFGSAAIAANDLTVRAWGLPQNAFAFFLTSRDAAYVVQAGGSQGNLCLGGAIGRYSGSAMSAGATGTVSLALDVSALAQPNGAVAAVAGETWRFQCWYRDANPSVTSNFSDAIAVRFE